MSTSGNGGPAPGSGAQFGSSQSFPKRFYTRAEVAKLDSGFALTLDGRAARTPARHPIALPTREAAEALAREWDAVDHVIDPRRMPMTRLVNSVIDGVSQTLAAVMAEVVGYASSDLIAYRAAEPPDLVASQRRAWDPVADWSRDALGAPLAVGEGVMFVQQTEPTLERLADAVRRAIGTGDSAAFRLGALHVMTTLTGSALLALAVALGRLPAAEAWAAAHVDEDFQIGQWGEDEEAATRRASRENEMQTAARLYALIAARDH